MACSCSVLEPFASEVVILLLSDVRVSVQGRIQYQNTSNKILNDARDTIRGKLALDLRALNRQFKGSYETKG